MDEARSILKECGEFVCQASASIPHSMQIAQASGGVASGSGDVEEVKESLDASTSKVNEMTSVIRVQLSLGFVGHHVYSSTIYSLTTKPSLHLLLIKQGLIPVIMAHYYFVLIILFIRYQGLMKCGDW